MYSSLYAIDGKTLPITHLYFLFYIYFHQTTKKLVGSILFDNHCGVDTDHAKGIIQYRIDRFCLNRLVDYQVVEVTFGIEIFYVDGWVDNAVIKRRQVAGKFQYAGGTHGMADDTFGIVDVGGRAVGKYLSYGLAFFNIALFCAGGMGIDEMNLFRP